MKKEVTMINNKIDQTTDMTIGRILETQTQALMGDDNMNNNPGNLKHDGCFRNHHHDVSR